MSRNPSLLVTRLGRNADRPRTAAVVVGTTAVVFSGLYYGNMAIDQLSWAATGRFGPVFALFALFLLTVANAVAVTWLVWSAVGFSGTWRYRSGVGAGLAIGLCSHVGLGLVYAGWTFLAALLELGLTMAAVEQAAGMFLLVSLYSVPLTAGIPILLSVASAVVLTYARKRVASA